MGYTGKVSGGICPVSWISTATLLTVCSPHTKTCDRIIPAAQHRAISLLARKTNHIERFNNTLRQRVSRLWHVFPAALHVFRTIPTFCASMAQKARHTCAIVL
jgi:hypothetical protein